MKPLFWILAIVALVAYLLWATVEFPSDPRPRIHWRGPTAVRAVGVQT